MYARARIRIVPAPCRGETAVVGEFDGLQRAFNEPFVARVLAVPVLVAPSPENSPVISARNKHGSWLVGGVGFDRASALAALRVTPAACQTGADGIKGSEVHRPVIELATRTMANARSRFLHFLRANRCGSGNRNHEHCDRCEAVIQITFSYASTAMASIGYDGSRWRARKVASWDLARGFQLINEVRFF